MPSTPEERLAFVRHELKSSLTIAQGYSELALEMVQQWRRLAQPTTPEQLALLARFLEQSIHGHEETLRLLSDLQTAEPDLFSLSLHPLELGAFVRNIVLTRSLLLPVNRLSFVEEGALLSPTNVLADGGRLSQVLTNYLDNALAYSSDETQVSVALERSETHVRVQVIDQGIGVSAAHLAHVWEQGYRTPQARAWRLCTGSGLGLFLVQQIIHRHGGTVGAESQPGRGSIFWFQLPLLKPNANAVNAN